MHEIICPHCKKAFKIDEAGYADILKQVRDDEFDQQLGSGGSCGFGSSETAYSDISRARQRPYLHAAP